MSQIFENKKKKMISLDTLNKVSKSICKLIIKNDKEEWTGTGFFMSIKFENEALINCLVTNYHIINENVRGGHVRLQIGDDKKDFNIGKKRYIKYFEKPIDFTIIEILSKDEFIKDVNFLSSDLNYIKYGYDYYLNKEIFILQHPYGEEMYSAIGKIININNFEFEHNAGTCPGSSGSAVIQVENNCVIGIHRGIKNTSGNKIGSFIGEVFKGLVEDLKLQKRIKKTQTKNNSKGSNEIEIEEPQKIINNPQSLSLDNGNELDKNNQKNTYKNVLTLQYIINKNQNNAFIFSKKFVNNNKDKFVMFINNERVEFCHHTIIPKRKNKYKRRHTKESKYRIENKNKNILEIKLKKLEEVKTFENMFEGTNLLSISGFSSFDTKELTDISNMFSGCKNLTSIIDIDYLNTSNIKKMNNMFYNCKSLESLPDISKWDTSNVTHIEYMFSGCEKLKSLPDISKWNISNVIQMNSMFSQCKSLISLPDISKWDVSKVKDISFLFSNCEPLLSIPNIQKWNTKNIESMNSLFYGCKSLTSIPDISKWNTNKIKDMGNLFNGSENATELPEISKCKNECDNKGL